MIIISGKAARDLTTWIDTVAKENSVAAEQFLFRVRRSLQMIDEHPEIGHRHPRRKVRYVVEPPLKIFYVTGSESIQILRFWHSARNPKSIRYK